MGGGVWEVRGGLPLRMKLALKNLRFLYKLEFQNFYFVSQSKDDDSITSCLCSHILRKCKLSWTLALAICYDAI